MTTSSIFELPEPFIELIAALLLLLQVAGSPTSIAPEQAAPEVPPSEAEDPIDPPPAPVPPPDEGSVGSDPPPEPPAPEPPTSSRSVWDDLADCESGNWIDGGSSFEIGSARWWWAKPGTEVPPWGTARHHGGLQFHPGTWSSFAPAGYPTHAYDATREQQITVAEKVLDAQGWGAWPTCARKLGLR